MDRVFVLVCNYSRACTRITRSHSQNHVSLEFSNKPVNVLAEILQIHMYAQYNETEIMYETEIMCDSGLLSLG